jgi:hypothetical protein
MRVHFSIDRLVIEGLELSPAERGRLEEELRESLREALLGGLVIEQQQPGALPISRNTRRERADLKLHGRSADGHLGKTLGSTLANHVWGGVPQDSK